MGTRLMLQKEMGFEYSATEISYFFFSPSQGQQAYVTKENVAFFLRLVKAIYIYEICSHILQCTVLSIK